MRLKKIKKSRAPRERHAQPYYTIGLHVRLPEPLHAAITARAKRRGITHSMVVRDILETAFHG